MKDADGQFEIENLSVLVFSVGGVRFGVESSQIAAIDSDRTNSCFKIIRLEALLGLAESTGNVDCIALEFRQENSPNRLLLVDKIEDIFQIPLSEIQLLPKVIAERLLHKGIWGVIKQSDNFLILLDFHRLLKNMESNISETALSTQIPASEEDII